MKKVNPNRPGLPAKATLAAHKEWPLIIRHKPYPPRFAAVLSSHRTFSACVLPYRFRSHFDMIGDYP